MAENSNEDPVGATPDPAPPDSTPEDPTSGDGPSEEDQTLALLSQPRRDLLTRVAEVLQEYGPKPGTLNDLPQVTVPAESIAAVCRLAKDDPELDFKMLLCMSCILIFDVEAVFLFPWAVVFLEQNALGNSVPFYAMMLFLGVLFFALIYAWRKGVLDWQK